MEVWVAIAAAVVMLGVGGFLMARSKTRLAFSLALSGVILAAFSCPVGLELLFTEQQRGTTMSRVKSLVNEQGVVFTPRMDRDVQALKEGDWARLTDELAVIFQDGEYQLFTLSDKIEVE